jgi:hypothetical protein
LVSRAWISSQGAELAFSGKLCFQANSIFMQTMPGSATLGRALRFSESNLSESFSLVFCRSADSSERHCICLAKPARD